MNKEDKIYPSMVIRSQAEAIELLENENQQLKKQKLDLIAKILNLQIELEVTNEIITMNINRINKLENENQQLKKQKDDVVEYIKEQIPCIHDEEILDNLLRMLGEIE